MAAQCHCDGLMIMSFICSCSCRGMSWTCHTDTLSLATSLHAQHAQTALSPSIYQQVRVVVSRRSCHTGTVLCLEATHSPNHAHQAANIVTLQIWRIHCGVEVTKLSTNKQHTLSGGDVCLSCNKPTDMDTFWCGAACDVIFSQVLHDSACVSRQHTGLRRAQQAANMVTSQFCLWCASVAHAAMTTNLARIGILQDVMPSSASDRLCGLPKYQVEWVS